MEGNNFVNEFNERLKFTRKSFHPNSYDGSMGDLFDEFFFGISKLTVMEKRVLKQYLNHSSIKEVAKNLFISLNTLKVHNRHIYLKLGVSSIDEINLYIRLLEKSNLLEGTIALLD